VVAEVLAWAQNEWNWFHPGRIAANPRAVAATRIMASTSLNGLQ
jgi:hypothetical protein